MEVMSKYCLFHSFSDREQDSSKMQHECIYLVGGFFEKVHRLVTDFHCFSSRSHLSKTVKIKHIVKLLSFYHQKVEKNMNVSRATGAIFMAKNKRCEIKCNNVWSISVMVWLWIGVICKSAFANTGQFLWSAFFVFTCDKKYRKNRRCRCIKLTFAWEWKKDRKQGGIKMFKSTDFCMA